MLNWNQHVEYKGVDIAADAKIKDALFATTKKRDLPQIFVNGKFIGVRRYCPYFRLRSVAV